MNQQYWSLRQNPYVNTNQAQMREIILSQHFVSCPFGHITEECKNNIQTGLYNAEAKSQDKKFIENMNVGDIVLIPFAGIKECILARIVSEPIYSVETGLFANKDVHDGKITFSTRPESEEATGFRPIGRQIEIINSSVIFKDKRVIPRTSLSHISQSIIFAPPSPVT